MKRNVLIIEDNDVCRNALTEITQRCESVGAVFCAGNSADAYKYAMEEDIHLFMIDIILNPSISGDVSGMIFADKIRKIERYKYTPIIFVTSLVDEKLIAYQNIYCSSYIEKPIEAKRVEKEVLRALGQPLGREADIAFYYYRKDGIIYSLETDKIICIESTHRRLTAYTTEQSVRMPYRTLKAVMRELPQEYFIQCSKSMIVNRRHIDNVDMINCYITMKDGRKIEIGSHMKKGFWLNYDC